LIIVGSPIFLTASANPEDAFWKSLAEALFAFCDDRSAKSDALDDAWYIAGCEARWRKVKGMGWREWGRV
jgi:hypothetical protein